MSGRLLEGRPWWGRRRIGKTSLDAGLSRYGSLGSQGTAADEQLAMDLGSAPQPVLKTHSSDEIAHLFADLRSAPERTGIPSPVGGEPVRCQRTTVSGVTILNESSMRLQRG